MCNIIINENSNIIVMCNIINSNNNDINVILM